MPEFQAIQAAFAAHLRDPAQPPPPGIEDRRMAIYRRLFINNVAAFLSQAFPVLRQLYAEEDWRALVRNFYARHPCRRPQFYQLAEEFLEYLAQTHRPGPADPPFLQELAHYERIELVLAIDPRPAVSGPLDPAGDLMSAMPVLTPWLHNLSYRYPVHRLGPEFQPRTPPGQPSFLLVFRGQDEQVGFFEINALTARLVERLQAGEARSGRDQLRRLAAEAGLPEASVLEFGAGLLQRLRERGVILGVRPLPAG